MPERKLSLTLPEFEPGPGLWPRIEAVHAHRRAQRRRRRAGWIGAALAAAIAAIVLLPRPAVDGSGRNDSLAWQQQSAALEQQWRRVAGGAVDDPGARAELRLIDRALQAAYDRGAGPEELTPLWQRRSLILRGLIANYRDAVAVTRI